MHTPKSIGSIRRGAFLSLFVSVSIGASFCASSSAARAEEAAATKAASAEVKAGKGVANHEPVEEGTSFTSGTMVWVWSRILNADGTTVQHVWKKDGKEVWSASLSIRSARWSTNSRRVVSPGQYEVEVRSQDGSALGSVSFSVQ